jgi:curli biogenesis system outer membrane secretion channel CsgG
LKEETMRRTLLTLILAAATVATAVAQQPKKRVAVMDFDYATVRSYSSAIFGTDQDIGKGIADLVVEKLVQAGQYTVVERKALDKIIAEQNFSNSDRADSNTAAKIARILGVDAIITGSITQFGRDDKSVGVGGGAANVISGRFGLGHVKTSDAKAVVGISARMINTDTAEILAAVKGLGESSRKGTSLFGAGGGDSRGGGGIDMSSSNFAQTIIGEAVDKATTDLCAQLNEQAAKLPGRVVVISGMVADATGGTLVLNVGSRAGLKVGDRLEVRRKIRDVKDPSTGRVLRSIEDRIGEVVVTEVDEGSAVGTFSGSAAAKAGDVVKSM